MNAVLHVISDQSGNRGTQLVENLVASAKGGADFLQVREKLGSALTTYQLVMILKQQLDQEGLFTQLIVNDRLDVALVTKALGVHLTARSLPVAGVRSWSEECHFRGYIGRSVHSLQEAVEAEQAGADYVSFGHVFPTESHPGMPPQGLHALHQIVSALSIPVLAIGGITQVNVGDVLATGCSGIAVIGAVLDAKNPMKATRNLKDAMHASSYIPKLPFARSRFVEKR